VLSLILSAWLCAAAVEQASDIAPQQANGVGAMPKEDCHVRWLGAVEHDFGVILQGKPVEMVFRFQNEGTTPITLQTARTTCGCTAAQWTETAVAPGDEGEIRIEYDAYKRGKFNKKIWVFFDCQKKPYYLHIRGRVKNKS
jgi:hypothetical protein